MIVFPQTAYLLAVCTARENMRRCIKHAKKIKHALPLSWRIWVEGIKQQRENIRFMKQMHLMFCNREGSRKQIAVES